eukprot:12552141-Ditylum_brightwellii.AAC.1
MLVAGSPEVTLSSMVGAALDRPPPTLAILVASSPEVALSSMVDAVLDPHSLVNLADCTANSSVYGHSTLLLLWSSLLPSTSQSASFKDENDTHSTTIT